jgi:iron complex outermembrane receptor protein
MTLKHKLHSTVAGLAMSTAIALSVGAHAQTATPPAPAGAPAASGPAVGEVIVTAQRRAERLQDVPIAITNLTKVQLENEQVNATADIPRLVPNMFTTNNTGTGSANVYFLRGLGQTESFATFDPQVGIYVDDIYIGRGSASNFGLYDVNNIEVLRGPQGTLFGRNSTGGAIVISLDKPAETFGGYVQVGYGAYNRFTEQASINIPLSDQIFTKTVAYAINDDGFVKDAATGGRLNYHDDRGLRESATFKPKGAPNVTWNVSADVSESTFNGEQNSVVNGQRVSYSGFGDSSAPVPALLAGPIIQDANSILKEPFTKIPNGENFTSWGGMSNLEVKFDAGTLNLITGLRGQDQIGSADFPFPGASGAIVPYDENELGQFGIFLNSTDRQYSQEVKWTGSAGDKLKYTAGLFYLYEENSTTFMETLTVPFGPVTAPSVLGLELSPPEHFHNTTTSTAGYAQADYKLTEKLTVTLGGRITNERKTYTVNSWTPFGTPIAPGYDTADVLAAGHPDVLKAVEFTPRAVLEYKFDPNVMGFASVTKGFQGGGWNSLSSSAVAVTSFSPETVWTYESGVRSQFLNRKLTLNADVFYNNVSNYQLVTLGPGSGNFVTENAASMYAYGLEADAVYHPIRDLTLSGNMGLQQGAYYKPSAATAAQQLACRTTTPGDCTQGIVNSVGGLAPPEDFPHSSFALNGVYVFHASTFDLTPTAGVQYTSTVHVDTSGQTDGISHSHAIMDAGLKYQLHNSRWYVTGECQNCLNTQYQTQLLFVKYYNTPEFWDIKVHYDF